MACAVGANQLASHDAFLIVPVWFTVTPEGNVAPGTAQAVGRITIGSRRTGEGDSVRRLKADEATARKWAQRNAESCTFEPATLDGQPIAVEVQQTFRYAN